MIIYLANPFRYPDVVKDLGYKRVAFIETAFNRYFRGDADLNDYLAKNFAGPGIRQNDFKIILYKEDGRVLINGNEVPYVEFPSEYPSKDIDSGVLVLKVLRNSPKSRNENINAFAWGRHILAEAAKKNIQVHLSRQTSSRLAISLSKFGLKSFDIDPSIDARFGKITTPDGKVSSLEFKVVNKKVYLWSPRFKLSAKLILGKDVKEIIKFTIKSIEYVIETGGAITERESRAKVKPSTSQDIIPMDSLGFDEKSIPQEVLDLPIALEEKDDIKIVKGLAFLLKEDISRFYRALQIEKRTNLLDAEVTKLSQNIVSKYIDLLKFTRPDLAGQINQYFLDNRKIVIGAAVNELASAKPEERKQLVRMVKELRTERQRSGSGRDRVATVES
jgi:hypothetical protein